MVRKGKPIRRRRRPKHITRIMPVVPKRRRPKRRPLTKAQLAARRRYLAKLRKVGPRRRPRKIGPQRPYRRRRY